jgi:zinc protease
MTKLLADVALRPTLAEAEWTKVRQQREAAVVAQRAEPAVAASRAFRAAAFAGTPFAHAIIGDLNSIRAMKLSDLKRVYAGFGPQGSALVAVGGAKADDVLALLRAQFGGWRTKGAAQRVPQAAAPADRPRLVLVDYPGKPQSVLVVGQPTVPRSSPDYLPLELMNAVLGGSFTSRLNQNLREQHGYSYGAASALQWGVSLTPFIARASVKTDVTGAALKETLDELQRAPELEPAELEKGRALLAFGLVEHFSSATALAGLAAEIWLYGLPPDELRTYVPRLRAVTTQSVQAAAQRDLAPAKMTIVIAGDTEKVQPQLAPLSLGPPQMRDAMGDLARK